MEKSRLRILRDAAGLTISQLAERVGVSKSQIVKLERAERQMTEDWMRRLADALEVAPAQFLDDGKVRVIGVVGAGAQIIPFKEDGDGDLGETDAPPNAGPNIVAVEVRGDSMAGQADDGSMLFFDQRRNPPDESLIGRLCIVWCADGRVLVKRLGYGSEHGYWSLISSGGTTERDVVVEAVARVRWIQPG